MDHHRKKLDPCPGMSEYESVVVPGETLIPVDVLLTTDMLELMIQNFSMDIRMAPQGLVEIDLSVENISDSPVHIVDLHLRFSFFHLTTFTPLIKPMPIIAIFSMNQ